MKKHGVEAEMVRKIREEEPNLMTVLTEPKVDFLINTPERDKLSDRDGLKIRRAAVEHGVPCLTSLDTANALAHGAALSAATARGRRARCP